MEFFYIIIWGLIWGFIAQAVGNSKGVKGFWWGFFLGIIGLIVVACMPGKSTEPETTYVVDNSSSHELATQQDNSQKYDKLEKIADLRDKGILSDEEYEAEKKKILQQDK